MIPDWAAAVVWLLVVCVGVLGTVGLLLLAARLICDSIYANGKYSSEFIAFLIARRKKPIPQPEPPLERMTPWKGPQE